MFRPVQRRPYPDLSHTPYPQKNLDTIATSLYLHYISKKGAADIPACVLITSRAGNDQMYYEQG